MDEEVGRLRAALEDAERRVIAAETRATVVAEELDRVLRSRNTALTVVLVVAVVGLLMLGVVAFNAVDELGTN